MPTDQSPDSATATDRRTFLTRAALGGALVSAGAVASPLGGLLTSAGAQEVDAEALVADDLLTDEAFATFAAPLELAAVVAYQTALSGDVLDGAVVPVHAGTEGLIIGDRLGATNRPKPDDAVVH